MRELLPRETFVSILRDEGARRYHDHHAFHQRMHRGELSRQQLQGWVLNRYYYQTRIPIKDALILSKSEDPAFRRLWIHRIVDHDGARAGEGGLELWLRLGEIRRGKLGQIEQAAAVFRQAGVPVEGRRG